MTSPRSVVFAALAICATFALTTAVGASQAVVTSTAGSADSSTSTSRASAPIALVPADQEATAGKVASLFLTRFHYRPRPLDANFSAVVFDKLIETLDPDRSYFTAADIAHFAPLRPTLGTAIDQGDLTPAFEPVNLYLNRVVEETRYAQSLLKDGFDLGVHESIATERKDVPWPASTDELHELWRQRAKEDWLRLKLAGQGDDAIRKTLAHRYANLASRIQKTSADDAFQLFMTAYAESTDPHTDYFAPKAATAFNTEMSLSLEGIGAYLREHDEYTQVTELIPGSPAAKSGKIHVGDRITGVGQGAAGPLTDVIGWRSDDVIALIKGKSGTSVRVELLPDESKGDVAPHVVTLTRRHISIEDEAAKQTVLQVGEPGHAHKLGIITVPSFYEDFDARRAGNANYRSVTRDVSRMLGELKKQKVDGVVIDLRDNGGGSLTEAADMVGLFTGAGPVVQVRSADGKVDVQGAAEAAPTWSGALGVLVNHGSASASEIFAAAIQDRGRGVILGQRTFGKGTVQNLLDLDDAVQEEHEGKLGELKMTIAQFYRINGASTQLLGVTPDIVFPATESEKDFGESTYTNALPASAIPAVPHATDPTTGSLIADLEHAHASRVQHAARWQLTIDELDAFQAIAARTRVSLNLDERKATREADLKASADFRARRKALNIADGLPVDDDASVQGDDGLDPEERSVALDKRPGPAKPSSDAYVQEAAQIVADEAAMAMTAKGA
ncbi:MAG TPA: carboxy terminal-processing peptidase [Luteibacter sp.]|uniref:carboxy terminal-processing peptidase n=1 Tax=Luteibacter sp. TaxID=1886636 RepID=UPI002C8D4D7C|nr:carboxy terminal-processing peptidase [Luteibacter sp.]HVI56867.1 carboxy terminal-processing peptidase [Luteibacter sp.]